MSITTESKILLCDYCNGSGKVDEILSFFSSNKCEQEYIEYNICPKCEGSGRLIETITVSPFGCKDV